MGAKKETKTSCGNTAALLAAVLADPEDDDVRLVYADALMQAGDPRGELITIQCKLAKAKRKPPALVKRADELFRAHHGKWVRCLWPIARGWTFSRGFASHVRAQVGPFAKAGARMFEIEPIESVGLFELTGASLIALAKAPHLSKVRSITFDSALNLQRAVDVSGLGAFLRSSHLEGLHSLRLVVKETIRAAAAAGVGSLFDGVTLPALKRLDVRLVPAAALASLSRAKLPQLEELLVARAPAGPRELKDLRKAFPRAKTVRMWAPTGY